MGAKKTLLRVRVQLRKDGECSKTAKKRPKNQSLDENGVFLTLNEECRTILFSLRSRLRRKGVKRLGHLLTPLMLV